MIDQEYLEKLAIKYGTDKRENGGHGYMKYFAKHLPENPKRILEIGCLGGASLRMWRELYPKAEIHSLDLFIEYIQPTDIENVIYWKGNQTDQYILEQLRRLEWDFISEDASHNSRDQLITYFSLAGSCDLYICEDLHCALSELYQQGLPFEQTMLGLMLRDKFPASFDLYDEKIAFIKR